MDDIMGGMLIRLGILIEQQSQEIRHMGSFSGVINVKHRQDVIISTTYQIDVAWDCD